MRTKCREVFAGVLFGLVLSRSALAQQQPVSAFGPGEQARYSVKYLGLTAGTAQVTVGAPMKQWGKDVWPIISVAKSDASEAVWPIKQKFVTYWEDAQQRVLGSDLHADENNKRRRVRVKMGEDGRTAQVVKQSEGAAPREYTHEVPEGTLDVAGATFALRNRPLAVGSEFSYPVFTGSRSFLMKAKVERKETLQTALGAREVFRVRVYTEFSGNLQSNRDMVAWFTTDASRLPVRVEADFALGNVVAELTQYQPGSVVARRDTVPGPATASSSGGL
jgi:hypothetical protein